MNIWVKNQQRRYRVNQNFIRSNIKAILSLCGLENIELSILFVNNRRMKLLNNQYRGKNSSTDVLSFPMYDGRHSGKKGSKAVHPVLLGDIAISMEKAHEQAKVEGHPVSRELLLLLTHGVLHLIGYDHEISRTEERRMRKKENLILSELTGGKTATGKIQMAGTD